MREWVGVSSADPALYLIKRFAIPGSAALLADGRVIGFHPPAPDRIGEIRIYRQSDILPYFDYVVEADQGVFPRQPAHKPSFRGYVHRMSAGVEENKYFGLWRRADGRPGSLVAAYVDSADAPQTVILGRSAMNFGTVAAYLRNHGRGPFGFMLTSETSVGRPLYLIRYQWAPSQR